MRHPDRQLKFVDSLHRVLAPGGMVILRLFTPPEHREDFRVVLEDFSQGKIRDLNILKLRLGAALQENKEQGVELGYIWEQVNSVAGDFESFARKIGWQPEHLQAINSYKKSTNRYYFVTVEEVLEMFVHHSGKFHFKAIHKPTYELGERCPTVVFQRAVE